MRISHKIKFIIAALFTSAAILLPASVFAQVGTIDWEGTIESDNGTDKLVLTGTIAPLWHTYTLEDEYSPIVLTIVELEGCEADGKPYLLSKPVEKDGEIISEGTVIIAQNLKNSGSGRISVKGTVEWRSCTSTECATPEEWEFNVSNNTDTAAVEENETVPVQQKEGRSIWSFILEAILWGLAMVLTPCVFPMVPMTLSFFLKGSENQAAGRFKAFMYGLFIILIYTVPICIIIFATRIIGGEAVTADIFNWLSTHWLPNILFFAVFMIFAISFFGAFEITLPSSLVNKTDANSDRKGMAGVFFMALTLVLVSFSCTGPIVGTVLIKSTAGEFWTPMVTMLAFSIAFALPFTILAFFPSVLKKFKNASWLGSVKIVFGFLELALGFKFLSTADQTYHWGILDREIYLAIWITVFSLLGLYLLGKIRFKDETPRNEVSIVRLLLSVLVFSFVVYMIPGMFGAPLKGISGYLPPMETQDFIMTASPVTPTFNVSETGPDIDLPHGLKGYSSLDEGIKKAQESGKPIFVDITGHGCVNCREMEARVWSDPEVQRILRDEYIIVALYTDDKLKLPEDKWITDENGKVFKDLGKVNSYIARTRFGVNAQPNYVLLSSEGNQLVPVRGYDLDIDSYIEFLTSIL